MKVVMPIATPHEEAIEALYQSEGGHHISLSIVRGKPTAYWWLFVRLWEEGKPFVLVEHDIVVRPDTISILESCERPWCGFVYHEAPGQPVMGLGCTKFVPDGADLGYDPAWTPEWANVDSTVSGLMTARGWTHHEHHPWLRHLNPSVAAYQTNERQ